MNTVRENARTVRLRIESGERFTLEEAAKFCVTLDEATRAFDGPVVESAEDGLLRIWCCGAPTRIRGGIFSGEAKCMTCGAEIVDALAPMSSPLLPRTSGSVTCPGKAMAELLGDRCEDELRLTLLILYYALQMANRSDFGTAPEMFLRSRAKLKATRLGPNWTPGTPENAAQRRQSKAVLAAFEKQRGDK